MKTFLNLLLSVSLLIVFSNNSFSQKKKISKGKEPVALKQENNNLSQTPVNNYSQEELDIMEQMNQIKQTNNSSSDGEKILELQKKMESINGSTITKQESNPIGTIIPANNTVTDNISPTEVIPFAHNYIAGIAAQVEQRGTTAGKIWLAVALASGDSNRFGPPDSIAVYYSTNNGSTYNRYATIAFSSYNRNDFDNIDMEIIENTAGTKYLHIVFGYNTNGGYGQKMIGYTVVSVPTLGYAGTSLIFPGYNSASQYIQARITSDNARYPSNPYITIVVTQDSISGANQYILSKVCRVLSPFTLSPAITYLPRSIYLPAEGFINNNTLTDVANYHNGSDSLIFVLSKYPGFTQNIYLYKAFSNSTVYPTPAGILTPTGDDLELARVAASGGTNQTKIMITYTDDYLNSGDFDQWILYADDANNWSSNVLDYTSYNNSKSGDVIARRNADGSFMCTFKNVYGYMENVSTVAFSNFSLSSSIHSLNTNYANTICAPKPLFRFVNNDSCLNLWSYYYTMYSTGGCSASNLYVTAALEGMYDEVSGNHISYMPVYILLANQNPPYDIIDTGFAYLDYTRLTNAYAFPRAPDGDYYLVVKHYNCLETWSAAPVHVDPYSIGFYDFTSSDAQAYGNNMTLKGSRWCIYSGDVIQDGFIDGTDLQKIDNDAAFFVSGIYYDSDLNGDNFVDGTDALICDNHVAEFIGVIKP